jgi:ArsR family transcriptional regulator
MLPSAWASALSRSRVKRCASMRDGSSACGMPTSLRYRLRSSQPTVSHHLKVLLRAGLVDREQRGSWAYFRVREEPLAALRELLA